MTAHSCRVLVRRMESGITRHRKPKDPKMRKRKPKEQRPLLEIFKNDELWRDGSGTLQTEFRDKVEKVLVAFENLRKEQRGDGRNFKANRTRLQLRDFGGIEALSRIVKRRKAAEGFEILRDEGRLDLSFEQVVDTHARLFDEETVEVAQKRLREGRTA